MMMMMMVMVTMVMMATTRPVRHLQVGSPQLRLLLKQPSRQQKLQRG
jgi:hypothetical protein